MFILNIIRGFCMALADSVPGVSGGTIAFVLGFYDKFIGSLKHLFAGSHTERLSAIRFLGNLGIGWIVGFILSVLFITSVFESHIYEISSLFLGFIIVSIPLIIKEEKDSFYGHAKYIPLLLLGIGIVAAMTYFNPISASGTGINVSVSALTLPLGLFVLVSGMIAISAMVLPGISGSTILLIFGLYAPILNAVKEVIHFRLAYVPVVMIFGIGVICGIALTIRAVKYCLDHYRSQSIYVIIGLMIGSLYAVVMGPQSLEVPKAAMTVHTFSIFFFILGGGLIVFLEWLKHRMLHHLAPHDTSTK